MVFAAFVVAMIFFAIGCTLQQRDLERCGERLAWSGGAGR